MYWKGNIYRQDYLPGILFKINGEIKSFTEKQKVRVFSNNKWALQQMWKGQEKEKTYKTKTK